MSDRELLAKLRELDSREDCYLERADKELSAGNTGGYHYWLGMARLVAKQSDKLRSVAIPVMQAGAFVEGRV